MCGGETLSASRGVTAASRSAHGVIRTGGARIGPRARWRTPPVAVALIIKQQNTVHGGGGSGSVIICRSMIKRAKVFRFRTNRRGRRNHGPHIQAACSRRVLVFSRARASPYTRWYHNHHHNHHNLCTYLRVCLLREYHRLFSVSETRHFLYTPFIRGPLLLGSTSFMVDTATYGPDRSCSGC